MKREQLEHLIRAAGGVTGSRRLIVIGSQAILGEHPFDAPPEAMRSREADLIPIDAPDTADVLTGTLGELSASSPVGRRATPIQESRLSEQERAGTDRGGPCGRLVHLT